MERIAILLMLGSLSFGCSPTEKADRQGKVVASAEPVKAANGATAKAPHVAKPLPSAPTVKASGGVSRPILPRAQLKSGTASGANRPTINSSRATTHKASPPKGPPFTGRKIALIHSANMIGEIEPCG
jgi:hypothetical protein